MRWVRTVLGGLVAAVVVGGVAVGATTDVLGLTGLDASPSAADSTDSRPAPAPTPTRADAGAGRTSTPTPSTQKTTTPTARKTQARAPLLERGDSGGKVRELQARLKQLRWYAPKITGTYDSTTKDSVRGFQEKREFRATGAVDRRTWKHIVAMSRQPTKAEMHNRLAPGPPILGPGDSGDEVRELQARLAQIGWFDQEVTDHYGDVTESAVSGFQTKREIPSTGEVDQRTMDRLSAMTHEPTEDELYNRAPAADSGVPLDPRCKSGRVLCIDKTSNSLRWVVDGEVRNTVDVRFGAEETPTREGEFHVTFKSRDHVSSLYHTAMPYSMFFSGGQAVHYSSDFAARGYAGASHGCVNVRDLDAIKQMFASVNVGDTVIVYRS